MDSSLIVDKSENLARMLAQIKGGEKSAMQTLYTATSAKLLRVIVQILGDRSESEDILQDVYLNVWQRAGKFNAETGSVMSWLIVMARNRAIDRLRRRGRLELDGGESALRLIDLEPCSFEQLEAKQQAAQIQHWLGEIDPRAAMILRSAFFEDCTYHGVAERLGLPRGTVKSTIRRNLAHIRSQADGDRAEADRQLEQQNLNVLKLL